MDSYVVLYRREDIMTLADPPFAFSCMAEDTGHAEEQCLNADPDGDIVWTVVTDSVEDAYADYYSSEHYMSDDNGTTSEDAPSFDRSPDA